MAFTRSEILKRYRERHPEAAQKWAAALKHEVFSHYSGGTPHCNCALCPEKTNDVAFLTIEHIGGGGAEHRRSLSKTTSFTGNKFYSWLKQHGYPPGYEVLCFNCNCTRNVRGHCH